MHFEYVVKRLEMFGGALGALLAGVSEQEAKWKPPSGAWSILEVVCHLADEEVEDFRARLRMTQEDPAAPWPAADPERWARDRNYNQQDLGQTLARFTRERAESVQWLRSLRSPDWQVTIVRPSRSVRAGDLLISWPAHDALHIRQIAKRMFELAGEVGREEGFDTEYAGKWGA